MSIIIYLLLLIFLLILFILFTAIGLTFKLTIQDLKKRIEFGGTFTVKWLLFSHTFSIEELKAAKPPSEEPDKSKMEKEVVETGDWQEKKESEQRKYGTEELSREEGKIKVEKGTEIGEKRPEEKKEKASPIDKIRGKKRVKKEDKVEPEMGLTNKEKLYWGLKAFRLLRKPFLRLFSDLLRGIKIKRLESYMTFGLPDPADTGMLCGLINATAGFIYSRCRYCSFSINPVFMHPMLDFRGKAEISVRIYSMIFPFMKFIFDKKTLSFTYSVIKEIFHRKLGSKWESKWRSIRRSKSGSKIEV
jgi:Protein of unknown function (DUF2953)